MLKTLTLIGAMLMLISCGSTPVDHYKEMSPQVDIKDYFTGPIKAWGIVQDWRGRVISRFDVTMVGSWDGDKGRLDEEFTYYDGSKQQRIWHITKLSENRYEGTAGDIVGKATGEESGSAVNWVYKMDVPVGDTTYRLTFDDWMWLMNDGVLINRSYMRKFGITVAELTLFMQKQP